MGEVIPGECKTNALYKHNYARTLSSLDCSWERLMWEGMQQKCVVEPMQEEEDEGKEGGIGKGSSTKDLVPKQAPVLQTMVPVVPEFWAAGPSI